MIVRMWESPSVRRNFETLKKDGVLFVGPNDGEMACGEFAPVAWPNRWRSSPPSKRR